MKKTCLILLCLLSLSANSSDLFLNETSLGCAAVGGANYIGNPDSGATGFITGCLIGGLAGYLADRYYTNKVSNRYSAKIETLETQIDEMLQERALNSSNGVGQSGLIYRRKRVPGKKLKNGTFQEPTFVIEPDLPGKDLILGN